MLVGLLHTFPSEAVPSPSCQPLPSYCCHHTYPSTSPPALTSNIQIYSSHVTLFPLLSGGFSRSLKALMKLRERSFRRRIHPCPYRSPLWVQVFCFSSSLPAPITVRHESVYSFPSYSCHPPTHTSTVVIWPSPGPIALHFHVILTSTTGVRSLELFQLEAFRRFILSETQTSTEAANLPVSICLASLILMQKMKSFLRLIVLHQQKHGRGRTLAHPGTNTSLEDLHESYQKTCKKIFNCHANERQMEFKSGLR